ncbi:DNA cytosine methyltransferase [Streptomyces microflavus]|uniref:DNA cytosine methyltransferase n=1 Tax=Streptomyces microflavus TaxID=1919 RepID=UPI0036A43564
MPILELCAGYGGLGLAVERLTGDQVRYVAETDPAASQILAARYPHAPNLGDITQIDWSALAGEVTTITAGFPCQDISIAGRGAGINGTRSGIWTHVTEAIRTIRPALVFLENVAVIRGRGMSDVLRALAEIGYDSRWCCYRASSVGAPHQRDRWFCLAVPENPDRKSWDEWRGATPPDSYWEIPLAGGGGGVIAAARTPPPSPMKPVSYCPTPTASDATGGPGNSPKRTGGMNLRTFVILLPHGGVSSCPQSAGGKN